MMLRWRSRALAVTLIAFIVLGTTGPGHAAACFNPVPVGEAEVQAVT